jgi:hypothetical protein
MYRIERVGLWRSRRIVSSEPLSTEDFDQIADEMGVVPKIAHKLASVAARRATRRQQVVTFADGEETVNEAAPGDWVVTSLTTDGELLRDGEGRLNQYVIGPEKFADLYQATRDSTHYGTVYRPRNAEPVEVLRFAGGFDIAAPWGERQQGGSGYLLRNGRDVYGNQARAFERTYVME